MATVRSKTQWKFAKMHIRLFCVFSSALAITFSYFGMNDHFAVYNAETVEKRAEGWPKDTSILDAYKTTGGVCFYNFPESTSCDGVYKTGDVELKDEVATLEPPTRAEFVQGVDGQARRTSKNNIDSGKIQIPDGWGIPDLPSHSAVKDYIKEDDYKEKLADWAQVCLREPSETEVGDNKYPMIYRDGKRIPDPHALDKHVFVLPVKHTSKTYKEFKDKKIGEALGACTFAMMFPTAQDSDLHLLVCAQANTDRTRRDLRKSYGFKQKEINKKRPVDFMAFWTAVKSDVDGYSTTYLPPVDSYLGQWLENYAGVRGLITTDNAAPSQTLPNNRLNDLGLAYPFAVVTCTGKEEVITNTQCDLDSTHDSEANFDEIVSMVGAPWAGLVCERKAAASTQLKLKAANLKLQYPVEFRLANTVNTLTFKGATTQAEANKMVECKGASSSTWNLKGGEGACTLTGIAGDGLNTVTFRPLPGFDLTEIIDTGKVGTAAATGDIVDFIDIYSLDVKFCNKAGLVIAAPLTTRPLKYDLSKGAQKYALTEKQWTGLAKYMKLHVTHHSKEYGSFDGGAMTHYSGGGALTATKGRKVHQHKTPGNMYDASAFFWQPLGPDSMKMEHVCLATMNTYHTHQKPDTPGVLTHNGRASYSQLGGLGSGTCHSTDKTTYHTMWASTQAIGANCDGQFYTAKTTYDDRAGAVKVGTDESAGALRREGFARSRFITLDLPELQAFRTVMYSWWYRGEEAMDEKLDALASMAHHTDEITDDNSHCDSFVSPTSHSTSRDDRFAYTLSQLHQNKNFLMMGADDRGQNMFTGSDRVLRKNDIAGIEIEDFANTHFDQIGDSMNTDLKCQRTCKNIKATNGVVLVSGALYLISVIGLVLPYNDSEGKPSMQTKAFLFTFFVITTCFTVSLMIHAGSLQRIQTGNLECTFHNDTAFFDVSHASLTLIKNTETKIGYGLLLLWIGAGFSALCWFVTAALTIAVMQSKDQTYLGGVSVNEFFFNG